MTTLPEAADAPGAPGASDSRWTLDPDVAFLNHGSFGACPVAVLEAQQALRARMEREPIVFLVRELECLLDQARGELGRFLGADPDDLAFLSNATAGVNTVLRSLGFAPGDELLTTDQGYNACTNALRFAAEGAGARVVVVPLPFPLRDPSEVVAAVMSAVTPRTRLALIDHVTSPTGLVLPLAELVDGLRTRGVDTLVDGAHAPGMVPVAIDALGAAYYTGNLHKWVCAPKGAAFLHVRRDRQDRVRPLVISHGANSPRTDRSRFKLEFDWVGTVDPTAWLSVPVALRTMAGLLPGGWTALMAHNHATALRARDTLIAALGIPAPAPDGMIGSLAAVPLPDGDAQALQDELFTVHRVEVPVVPWPAPPSRLLRVSAQLYNRDAEYQRLGAILRARFG